tara:strand:+ start:60 stop:212 length:153 start_codon:yes stop_codon:yes gene_type:complete
MFLAQVIEREEVEILGKTKDEENVQNVLSNAHYVSTQFNVKKRQEIFSGV